MLSTRRIELYESNSKIIKFLRRNPVIACEVLLGIKLMDSQKYILQQSWNAPYVLWCCSRNFGKSFLGAIIIILKALLYENQSIYIISSVGEQSKETFTKIEEIILRMGKTASSIQSLKDILQYEVVSSPSCKTGFIHSQTGYHVEFYNGSEIFTLNGNPDNNRSRDNVAQRLLLQSEMTSFNEIGKEIWKAEMLIRVEGVLNNKNQNMGTYSIDLKVQSHAEHR